MSKQNDYPQVVNPNDNRQSQIRLIVDENNVGVVSISQGWAIANEKGLDLVEVAENVCKVIDFGGYLYHQKKKHKKSKKVETKEIKLKPHISDHDLEIKIKKTLEFLEKGSKVKVSVMFHGRDIQHKDIGEKLVEKIITLLNGNCKFESEPKHEGNNLNMVLIP